MKKRKEESLKKLMETQNYTEQSAKRLKIVVICASIMKDLSLNKFCKSDKLQGNL
jgi:hypothetical protein